MRHRKTIRAYFSPAEHDGLHANGLILDQKTETDRVNSHPRAPPNHALSTNRTHLQNPEHLAN